MFSMHETQCPTKGVGFGGLLGGSGGLVSRLITPITHIVALIIPIINLLTKSPSPKPETLNPKP